jgi:adenylate cyclase
MMLAMSRSGQHRYTYYLAFLILLVFLGEIFWLRLFSPLENRLSDALIAQHAQISQARFQPDSDIVIIDIDERSLALLAESVGRWPWPRALHAELLQGLERQQPRAVVFDVLFSDPDLTRPESDAYFAEVVAGTRNSFFPMLRLQGDDPAQGIPLAEHGALLGIVPGAHADPQAKVAMVLPLPAMLETGRLGAHNAIADADGVVRRYVMYFDEAGWQLPSLPLTVARHLQFDNLPQQAEIILNWHGPALSYQRVSYADIYEDFQRAQPARAVDEFTDKIVIIGATANGLHDVRPTPVAAFHPGVEILATAIDNLKNHDPLVRAPAYVQAIIAATLLGFLAFAFACYRRIFWLGLALAVATAGLVILQFWVLRWQWLLPSLTLVIFVWLYYIVAASIEYLHERKVRQRAVETFSRFLDPRVVQALVEKGETTESLSGTSRQISVLFSDIRGFTTLSETSSPEQIVELLNRYFTLQAGAIFKHQGTLDKYIGDAIMAFWGAPVEQPDHALLAVAAALEMSARLEQFRDEAGELAGELDIGIGVHSGKAVVGFIGSDNRQDYTAIGDTVNLSSRIEGLTKGVARVLVSEDTMQLCLQHGEACPFVFEDKGRFTVKGRTQAVRLYEPRKIP